MCSFDIVSGSSTVVTYRGGQRSAQPKHLPAETDEYRFLVSHAVSISHPICWHLRRVFPSWSTVWSFLLYNEPPPPYPFPFSRKPACVNTAICATTQRPLTNSLIVSFPRRRQSCDLAEARKAPARPSVGLTDQLEFGERISMRGPL